MTLKKMYTFGTKIVRTYLMELCILRIMTTTDVFKTSVLKLHFYYHYCSRIVFYARNNYYLSIVPKKKKIFKQL